MTIDCDLIITMEARHPGVSKNLAKEGSETIDHILIPRGTENTIVRCGQILFNLGFHTDHRVVFSDLNASTLLNMQTEEPADHLGRRLRSKNEKK